MRALLILSILAACGAAGHGPGARACVVGDLGQSPSIEIAAHPPDCCYGSWAGTIEGIAANVDTASTVVVLYAQTDNYYIQPYAGSRVEIACDGGFGEQTHGGHHYAAVLAQRTWAAPDVMPDLPPVGGEVLAVARVPERRIEFSGYTWLVKSSLAEPTDPGPNYWSDSEQNVWVDPEGRLHLKITHEGNRWFCAEVYAEAPLGYGAYTFHLESRVDDLDPAIVLGLFVYERTDQEIDIEIARWGDPFGPNGQFVVQPWSEPGNRYRFSFAQSGEATTHRFVWNANEIAFASWDGDAPVPPDGPPGLFASWLYTGPDVPAADLELPRMNLWLIDPQGPTDQQEVEVIIGAFTCEGCAEVPIEGTTWGRVRGSFRRRGPTER